MAWPAIAMMGAGVLSGILGNAQKAKQAKAQMMMRAAEQESAPWTGMPVQTSANFDQGGPGNVLQGAISGYGSGQAIESAMNKDALAESQLGFQKDELALKKEDLALQRMKQEQQDQQNNAWMMMNSQKLPASNMYKRV